jgi:hypothetical protein
MGLPQPGQTIERVDNNGNYEPGNCRWATVAEQNRNKSDTVLVTIDGVTLCLADWSARSGIATTTLGARWRRGIRGQALLAPPMPPNERPAFRRHPRGRHSEEIPT